MKQQNKKSGFTLVELAIVLVIIGLIVGGVLAGQDLIKAAEQRAAVGQIEKMDTAVNVFRGKYNGLPGDFTAVANFGTTFATTGLTGNGNGLIQALTGGDTATSFDTEAAAFFPHLASAGLLTETVAGTDFTAANVDTIASHVPTSKLGRGSVWIVRANGGNNYYFLGAPSLSNGAFTFTAGTEIPVIDALGIDTKLDDAVPTTGKIIAVTDFITADAGAAAADNICVNTTPTTPAYNTSNSNRSSDTECTIRIRASF